MPDAANEVRRPGAGRDLASFVYSMPAPRKSLGAAVGRNDDTVQS